MVAAWLWTITLNGTLGWAGYGVARYGLRQPPGLPRFLAAVVLAWVWVTLGLEVLGAAGLLARAPLLLWTGAGGACALICWAKARSPEPSMPAMPGSAWGFEVVLAVGLTLWIAVMLGSRSLIFPVKVVSDGPIYHLYFAARWWKTGRLFLIATPFGENAATYFPAIGDLWFTWLMVCWSGDQLAPVGQAPFFFVAAAAAYGLARRLGASPPAAILGTLCFATSTPLILYAFEPNVDSIFTAAYMLAAYFLARDALGDDHGPSLVLGALAAGCALGAKATGVVLVPPLLALAALGLLTRRANRRRNLLDLLALALLPLVAAGYWFGNNFLLTGNPLYPLHVSFAGRVWLRGWYGADAMRFSLYYMAMTDWRACADQILAVVDPRLMPVWLASLAGAWTWGRKPTAPLARWVWLCAGLTVLNIGLFWILIPYRTQQRFMFPALGVATVPMAMTLDRRRWLRAVVGLLLALHLLTPQGWPLGGEGKGIPWDFSPLVQSGAESPVQLPYNRAEFERAWSKLPLRAAHEAALVVAVTAIFIAWLWSRATGPGATRARQRTTAVVTVAWLGVVLAVFSSPRQDPRHAFFPMFAEYERGWTQLDLRSGSSGARVAYAGTDVPYYLLGVGLRNDVQYVNIDGHPDWLMHDYHRASGWETWPTPRPGWDRIHPDYDAWLANLRAAQIQLLVVTPAKPREGRHNIADAEGFPIERQWADAHPETFVPLYGQAEGDRHFRLYGVRPAAR